MPNYETSEAVMRGENTRAQLTESEYRDQEWSARDNEPSDARISSQLDYMTEQVSIAHKMLSKLTNDLEPILIPEIDGPETRPGDVPRKLASDMSNRIDDLNSQISRLQSRMETVMQRIQL